MDELDLCPIAVSVNGVERSLAVASDETLPDVPRDRLGLTRS
jgi:aerobic-type carbon monoxide dehydrogenase small subunit (CoxS/CutS family)